MGSEMCIRDRHQPSGFFLAYFYALLARRPAFLVFFTAAAGAGVVPADLDGGSHRFGLGRGFGGLADHVLSLVGGAAILGTEGTGGLVDGL